MCVFKTCKHEVPWVLQTTEWRCSCTSVALPEEEEAAWRWLTACGSIRQKRVGRSVSTCQFRPHLRKAADGSYGRLIIRPQHSLPLRCGWNPDGAQTGRVIHAGHCVASRMKTSGSTLQVPTAFLPKKASPGFNFTFKTKWLFVLVSRCHKNNCCIYKYLNDNCWLIIVG